MRAKVMFFSFFQPFLAFRGLFGFRSSFVVSGPRPALKAPRPAPPLRSVGSAPVPPPSRVQPLGARVRPRQAATPRRRNAQEPAAGPEPAAVPSSAPPPARQGRIRPVVLTGVKKK